VADHDRIGKTALGKPARRDAVVFDGLRDRLERGAFGLPRVARAQNVVSAPIEREAGKPELR
jgi:hypothetical protein